MGLNAAVLRKGTCYKNKLKHAVDTYAVAYLYDRIGLRSVTYLLTYYPPTILYKDVFLLCTHIRDLNGGYPDSTGLGSVMNVE